MPVTAKQIAQRLGVSPSTVSRVLNGRDAGFVSEATRQRVLQTAQEMGYHPHRAARALVTGKTGAVAVWMYALNSSFHAQVVHLLESTLRRDQYDCLIYSLEHFPAHLPPAFGQVDGIIAHECVQKVGELLKASGENIPAVVNIGGYYLTEVDHVGIDLYAGARQAMQHLLGTGCRRVAYVVNRTSNHAGEPRGEAYRQAIQEAGLAPEYIIAIDQSRFAARDAMREYLSQHSPPDGVFCHNDQMAIGVYRALREAGVRIPETTAIVGCDGIEEAEFLDVPLSTIVQPLEEMCQLGWQFLQRRMERPDMPIQGAVLQPRLVIRESSQRSRR